MAGRSIDGALPTTPASTWRLLPASTRHLAGHGRFRIAIVAPGLAWPELDDPGLLQLGRFDHARLEAGALVPMHWHRDDEILSLVIAGTLHHRDTAGAEEAIAPRHMMLMSSGRGLQHEERVEDGVVEMLQIFLRPAQGGLPPAVAFADPGPLSADAWRLVAGPAPTGAALVPRTAAIVADVALHERAPLPAVPAWPSAADAVWVLYVAEGGLTHADKVVRRGDMLTGRGALPPLVADAGGHAVLFLLDPSAPFTRDGMFSGMR